MTEESETPLGVKMLADHLVKVKLQYEERINDLLLHIRGVEKEKVELQLRYKQVEDELELRKNEIFQMKRETSAQYVIEERENWKAMLNQERKLNEKLNKDMEIYKSRIVLLEEQLKNEMEAPVITIEPVETSEPPSPIPMEENPLESVPLSLSTSVNENSTVSEPIITSSLSFGPPQPELPPSAELDDVSVENLTEKKEELEREIQSIRDSIQQLQQELEESKQINLRLTDQFIHKVDSLESDHRQRENDLLSTIEGLKAKLDIELEKKWELTQRLNSEGQGRSGFLSFLWG